MNQKLVDMNQNLDRRFFKTDAAYQGFSKLHPKMQEVAKYAVDLALKEGVTNPCITETFTTKEHDKALGRVSESHSQGRAIDFRTWNMNDFQLQRIHDKLERAYGQFGAFAKLTGQRQLVVYHDIGKGAHFHVQLDRSFAMIYDKHEVNNGSV